MPFINGDWYQDLKNLSYKESQLERLQSQIPTIYTSGEKIVKDTDDYREKLKKSHYKLVDISHGVEYWRRS